MKVIGPLSNLWNILENLSSVSRASHEVDNVDNVHMCFLLEQTVCLLDQASVAVDHHRRMNRAVKITCKGFTGRELWSVGKEWRQSLW